ncbi:MAG TPA: hypothetical protein VJN64_15500 [Terriglobales bacterium]|nr:hypothetical protein [Terriglobales bacterium]
MKPIRNLLLSVALLACGCRSRVIYVELTNVSQKPLYTITVDYPGATFGVNRLEAGKSYRYAIKPQETGPLKIQFADADGKTHNYSGLELHKNDEGSAEVKLDQQKAEASLQLSGG